MQSREAGPRPRERPGVGGGGRARSGYSRLGSIASERLMQPMEGGRRGRRGQGSRSAAVGQAEDERSHTQSGIAAHPAQGTTSRQDGGCAASEGLRALHRVTVERNGPPPRVACGGPYIMGHICVFGARPAGTWDADPCRCGRRKHEHGANVARWNCAEGHVRLEQRISPGWHPSQHGRRDGGCSLLPLHLRGPCRWSTSPPSRSLRRGWRVWNRRCPEEHGRSALCERQFWWLRAERGW